MNTELTDGEGLLLEIHIFREEGLGVYFARTTTKSTG
jgi:hypothetical protein